MAAIKRRCTSPLARQKHSISSFVGRWPSIYFLHFGRDGCVLLCLRGSFVFCSLFFSITRIAVSDAPSSNAFGCLWNCFVPSKVILIGDTDKMELHAELLHEYKFQRRQPISLEPLFFVSSSSLAATDDRPMATVKWRITAHKWKWKNVTQLQSNRSFFHFSCIFLFIFIYCVVLNSSQKWKLLHI